MIHRPSILPDVHQTLVAASRTREDHQEEFAELVGQFRKHAKKIALWLCFCWAAAGVLIVKAAPEYVASTQIVLQSQQRQRGASGSDGAQIALDSAQADSRIQVIKSERLLRFVYNTLELGKARQETGFSLRRWMLGFVSAQPALTPEQADTAALLEFMNTVSVRRLGLSYVIEISVRAGAASDAAKLANAVTDAYLRDLILSNARDGELLQGRLINAEAEAKSLLDGIRAGVVPNAEFPDADARIISAAIEPLSKSSPQPLLTILLATFLGLLASVGLLAYRMATDRRLRSRQQARRKTGLPCLAVMPRAAGRSSVNRSGDPSGGAPPKLDSHQLDALQAALSVIVPATLEADRRAIGIVSWNRREGAGVIAYGLAAILAECGQPVSLVDADMSDPHLTIALARGDPDGLVQALRSNDPVKHLTQVPLAQHLDFVPSGAIRPSAGRMYLRSKESSAVVHELRRRGSVIINLSPISLSSDAKDLGALIDGVILVARADVTIVDDVREAALVLESGGVRLLGLIFNEGGQIVLSEHRKKPFRRPHLLRGREESTASSLAGRADIAMIRYPWERW